MRAAKCCNETNCDNGRSVIVERGRGNGGGVYLKMRRWLRRGIRFTGGGDEVKVARVEIPVRWRCRS